ncbi:MAG: SDR family NAD(P)-dependent oxidoreductase, partial [Thermomicrobiales bacterium]
MATFEVSENRHFGRLGGKTAVVTGAGNGIGRAVAVLFAHEGARVLALDIDEEGGRQTVRLLAETGGPVQFEMLDVTDSDAVDRVIEQASARFGPATILINCAGIMPEGTVLTTTDEVWNHVLDVNLTSMFLLSRAVIRRLVADGFPGSIVNISSVQGLRGHPQRIA